MTFEIAASTTSDGYRLRHRRWRPAAAPRGIVVALHGIQSHSGWYEFSSRTLCEAGWEVRFLDRRGSGLNDDDRGHARHADRLVNDVVQALQSARWDAGPESTRPVVLLGLSWGGRLAACVAARRPELIDGLALLYPGIAAQVGPTWVQRGLLRLAIACGKLERTAAIPLDDPALFTSSPQWQKFIRNDPLALRRATTGFFAASAALEREALAAAPRIAVPTLMMLAEDDRIIDNAGARRWFASVASAEKTLIEFPDAAHTLEFEPCQSQFVDALVVWLDGLLSEDKETERQ